MDLWTIGQICECQPSILGIFYSFILLNIVFNVCWDDENAILCDLNTSPYNFDV